MARPGISTRNHPGCRLDGAPTYMLVAGEEEKVGTSDEKVKDLQ
jgi:hypothetical protein